MTHTRTDTTWTILSLIQWSDKYLRARGIEHPRLNAERMLASVLGCERIQLYTRFDQPLRQRELEAYKSLFLRRLEREPLQYILGETEFYGRRFAVRPPVLIPRPETEHLVEAAIETAGILGGGAIRILDAGTGSGCIAVTLAAELPDALVTAVDLSSAALEVARENAESHGVAARIGFHCTDMHAADLPLPAAGRYDIVAANPPYIPVDVWKRLPVEIKDHEPESALTDGGDGLSHYRKLSVRAPNLLNPGGWMLCELGHDQFARAAELFTAEGARQIRMWNDLNDIKRIIGGTW
jgi:release factor glutamine methyltransferase